MSEDAQVIIDASDLRKYRTELPNLYDDSELTVYEFRLLAHYKRVGKCTEGLETTSQKCRMSASQASETRQSLADKGFIRLEKVPMDQGRYRYNVQVIDRWIENFARYSGLSEQEIAKQLKNASHSPHEGSPSHSEGKKELFKNLRDDRFGAVAQKLSELTGGALNSITADLINEWLSKHTNEWIIKAIDMSIAKGAKSEKYVDRILIGWEANGYPKSRAEQVQGAKHANGNSKSGSAAKRAEQPRPAQANPTDADRAAAERVKKRRANQAASVS
jgi:DnaD/phage-associated family protein